MKNHQTKQNKTPMEHSKVSNKMVDEKISSSNIHESHAHPGESTKMHDSHNEEKMTATNDYFMENNNALNKLMNVTKDTITDMYENQIKNRYDYYNTLMSSFLETNSNGWNPGSGFTDMFFNINPLTKSMLSPFTDSSRTNYINQYAKTFDMMFKEMIDFDQKMFDLLSKEVQSSEKNWNKSNETLKKAFENRLKATQNILQSNMDLFDKQLSSTKEVNRKQKEKMLVDVD
jgi:hypothetical protein